jgi:hypothetical protein
MVSAAAMSLRALRSPGRHPTLRGGSGRPEAHSKAPPGRPRTGCAAARIPSRRHGRGLVRVLLAASTAGSSHSVSRELKEPRIAAVGEGRLDSLAPDAVCRPALAKVARGQ